MCDFAIPLADNAGGIAATGQIIVRSSDLEVIEANGNLCRIFGLALTEYPRK